jgi:hypothetical protein
VAGVWQADVPAGPWTVEFTRDGTTLTGAVYQNVMEPTPFSEGKVEGNVGVFSVAAGNNERTITITFTGRIDGDEIRMTRDVQVRPGGAPGGNGIFGAAATREFTAKRVPDGQAPRRPRGAPFLRQLALVDREGRTIRTIGAPGNYNEPAISPDGARLAVILGGHVHVFDLSTGRSIQITSGPTQESAPVWSPDGRRIAYASVRDNRGRLYARSSDGTGEERLLFQYSLGAGLNPTQWSPDGRFIAFFSGGVLYAAPVDGDVDASGPGARKAIELIRADYAVVGGRLSPDGRYVSYRSDQSGRNEVYIRSFDPSATGNATGVTWQVSKDGALAALPWRRTGGQLYLVANDGRLIEVDVTTTPVPKAGEQRVLFKIPDTLTVTGLNGAPVTVSPDGQFFVLNVPQPPQRAEVTVAPEILAKYAGTYAPGGGNEGVVTFEDGRLVITVGTEKRVLRAASETSFFFENSNEEIEFIKDDKGAVTHLVLSAGNPAGQNAPRK